MRSAVGALFMLVGCSVPTAPNHFATSDAGLPTPRRTEVPSLVPDYWPTWLPTPEHAIAAWPTDMLTERCERETNRIDLSIVTWEKAIKSCTDRMDQENKPYGCYYSPAQIIIAIDIPFAIEILMAHELAHWLYACSGLGASNSNHDETLFVETIIGILDVWEAEMEGRDPVPAPKGMCPGVTTCGEDGICVNSHGDLLKAREEGDCDPIIRKGLQWIPEIIDNQCLVTCD